MRMPRLIRKLFAALALLALLSGPAFAGSDMLRIGDILAVSLPGEEALTADFAIDRQGEIQLPEVGSLKLAGKTLPEASGMVKKSLSQAFRELDRLSVRLKERKLVVAVAGQVRQPGTFELPGDANVQVAIAQAGGIVAGAQLDALKVLRGSKKIPLNYKKFLDTGDMALLPVLEPLDVIFVPTSPLTGNVQIDFDASLAKSGDGQDGGAAVKIFGEVNTPAQFSLKDGDSVIDVIMRAGGVTRYAAVEQIRIMNGGQPSIFNLQAYLDSGDKSVLPVIEPGATIFVPIQVEQIRKGRHTIYVMGEVAKPGAFEMQAGATFVDILANSGGPTRYADPRQIRILKADGSVVMFDMGAFTEGKGGKIPVVEPGDAILMPEKIENLEPSWLKVPPTRAVQVIGALNKPGRYEWSDEMTLFDLIAAAGGPGQRGDLTHVTIMKSADDQARPVVFDMAGFILRGGDMRKVPRIKAGYVVMVPELPQDPSNDKAQWLRQESSRSIYIMGAVVSPGRFAFDDTMGFLDILTAAEGPVKSADIRHIRISRRGQKVADTSLFDLARYMETGDESLLPDVRSGDLIYVPDREQQWTEAPVEDTVRVIGAVAKPGRYPFNDTMSLLDILAEAGGPTEEALQSRIIVVNMGQDVQASFFDLVKFARTADFTKLPVIRAGDTLYVPDKSQGQWARFMAGVRDTAQIVGLIAAIAAL